MKYDVRAHGSSGCISDGISSRIFQNLLGIIMYPPRKSLGIQQFLENCLSPVALHLAPVLECGGKFVCALPRGIAVRHQALYVLPHLTVPLGLLLAAVIHGLLELFDFFLQGIDNLTEACTARLRELLLPGLQHFSRLVLHLG